MNKNKRFDPKNVIDDLVRENGMDLENPPFKSEETDFVTIYHFDKTIDGLSLFSMAATDIYLSKGIENLDIHSKQLSFYKDPTDYGQ